MPNEERHRHEPAPEADGLEETHNLKLGLGGAVGVAGGGATGAAVGAVLGGPVGGLGGAVAGGVLGAAVTQGVSPVEPGENSNAAPTLPEEAPPASTPETRHHDVSKAAP